MLSIETHFDESGTDGKELTLAGYLFEASRIDEFCTSWLDALRPHNLPYFHMVDCAHGSPPFNEMTPDDRVRIQMRLMRLIKRFSVNGIVCNIANRRDNSGRSYLEAVQGAARQVADWAGRVSFEGKVAYLFEAGARGQGSADRWFQEIASDLGRGASYHYAKHSFVPKENNPGVQAADLLAWQYHNFTKKRQSASLARLDLRALLRHPHFISDACGKSPRESLIQTPKESRDRNETVYYLPIATPEQVKEAGGIVSGADTIFIKGANTGKVLACPNCYRAICEDYSLEDMHSKMRVAKPLRHLVIVCWCRTNCLVPPKMIPCVW